MGVDVVADGLFKFGHAGVRAALDRSLPPCLSTSFTRRLEYARGRDMSPGDGATDVACVGAPGLGSALAGGQLAGTQAAGQ